MYNNINYYKVDPARVVVEAAGVVNTRRVRLVYGYRLVYRATMYNLPVFSS